MTLAFERDERNRFVDAILQAYPGEWSGLDRSIDARDEMLEFAMVRDHGDRDRALAFYFLTGLEILEVIRWCVTQHFGSGAAVTSMLDFASGYGRVTRFVLHTCVARELHVSDILADAMEFQAQQFGVRTILSATNPDDLLLDRQYDLITVASLFTHLPERTFHGWLAKLSASLTLGGLLLFSVHDQSLASPTPGDTLHFVPTSESKNLDTAEYGSTWVSEAYVRRSVAAVDPALRTARLPRAFSGYQDVYVVGRTLDVAALEARGTLRTYFDDCVTGAETIALRGWATEVSQPLDRVELLLDGERIASTREFSARADVAAMLGDERAMQSGWSFDIAASRVRSFHDQVIVLVAVNRAGARHMIYTGTVASAVSYTARVAALRSTLETMRMSRFWKLRERWFRLKRALRLTDAP